MGVSVHAFAERCAGCFLCRHRHIVALGIFLPQTDEMRAAVLLLRTRPPAAGRGAGLAYGLCRHCFEMPDVTQRIEDAIVAAAGNVVLKAGERDFHR